MLTSLIPGVIHKGFIGSTDVRHETLTSLGGPFANTCASDGGRPGKRASLLLVLGPGHPWLAGYADDPALVRRPTPPGLSRGEERALRWRTWLAPEAERVIAGSNGRDLERKARDARMIQTKRSERDDSRVARRPGRPLHAARPSERHRYEIDPYTRKWRVPNGRRGTDALPPMSTGRREPQT
jgi:hypothetical protein